MIEEGLMVQKFHSLQSSLRLLTISKGNQRQPNRCKKKLNFQLCKLGNSREGPSMRLDQSVSNSKLIAQDWVKFRSEGRAGKWTERLIWGVGRARSFKQKPPTVLINALRFPPNLKVLRTGLIPAANGSAYIETGSLKLACAVWVASSSFSHLFHATFAFSHWSVELDLSASTLSRPIQIWTPTSSRSSIFRQGRTKRRSQVRSFRDSTKEEARKSWYLNPLNISRKEREDFDVPQEGLYRSFTELPTLHFWSLLLSFLLSLPFRLSCSLPLIPPPSSLLRTQNPPPFPPRSTLPYSHRSV